MDLQRPHKAFRLPKGDDAGHNGRDAFFEAILGHFQQDDGSVRSAYAREQIVDRSVFKQITHGNRVDDGDRLKHDLLSGPADGCHLGEIRDPDVHADQRVNRYKEQEYREIAHRLSEVFKISGHKKTQKSADDCPKCHSLGQSSVRIVDNLPISRPARKVQTKARKVISAGHFFRGLCNFSPFRRLLSLVTVLHLHPAHPPQHFPQRRLRKPGPSARRASSVWQAAADF